MNQEQRKFLIGEVEKSGRIQIEKLKAQIPPKPALNNYLIAAFLDNSIQFADIGVLKKKMRAGVLKLGTSEKLVITESDRIHGTGSWAERDFIKADPSDLFVIPESYLGALAEYEKKKIEVDSKIEILEATQRTIVMKIQIGSAAAMDKLITQIDSIGDLNVINAQLMLGDGGR